MPDKYEEELRSLMGGATNRETSTNDDGGLWSSFVKTYDKFDRDWLPDAFSGKNNDPEGYAKYAEDNWGGIGSGLAKVYRGANAIGGGVANALVGSPVRTASTGLTLATGPVAIASKLGSALKPIGYAARGMDAINSMRGAAQTVENVQEGNYGRAAGSAVGAGLSAIGATVPIGPRVNKPVPSVGGIAKSVEAEAPALVPNQIRVTSELPPVTPPVSGQGVLPEMIGGRPAPTQFSKTVVRPNPKGLLEESSTELLKGKRVGDEASQLLERGTRELDALKIPANEKNLMRYKRDTEFRARVQSEAKARGFNNDYSPTNPARQEFEAPVPLVKNKDVTITDVRAELVKRGVANPSDQLVARVRRDPALLDKMGMTEPEMVGSVMPPNQVKGLLNPKTTKLNAPEPSQASLFSKGELPEAKLAVIETKQDLPIEVRDAAAKARQKFSESGILSQLGKDLGMSVEEELKRIGPIASEIGRLEKIRGTDTPILYNQYAQQIEDALKPLDRAKDAKVWDYVEGNLANAPDDVRKAGDAIKRVLQKTGAELEGVGLLERGARGENYMPHRWEQGFFDNPVKLQDRLREAGKSESEIDKIMKYVRERGERKITAQFSRGDFEIPGYRKDREALFEHISDIAHRVTTSKLYGAKDIDDPASPLSKLVNSSEDPERVRNIMKRLLDRDAGAEGSGRSKKLASVAQNYATGSFLSQFTISNLGGTLPLALKSSLSEVANGFKTAFKDVDPSMKFMDNINHYQKIVGTIGQSYSDVGLMNKLFGIEKAQNFMNKVAAGTGKGYAEVLFNQLKSAPDNRIAREQLEDLILDPIDSIMKQPSLTQKQIERAMVRMADITQGVNEGRKLPHEWNRTGIARIPQVFMRYNFQTTKVIKDAILQDPIKNGAKLLAVGTLLGEFLGDAKEALSTTGEVLANKAIGDGSKSFGETYAENIDLYNTGGKGGRFDFARKELQGLDKITGLDLASNPAAVRAFGNLQQAFALGIPFDIMTNLAGEDRTNLGDLFVIPSEAQRAIGGVRTAVKEGSLQNVGREVIKRVPYIGRGVAREIPSISQSKNGTKGKRKAQNW